MKKGLFITFEGIEGSGKTTQVLLLTNRLRRQSYKVIKTREPGGTKIGEKIRGILLDKDNAEMFPLTELMLYMASRAQHYKELIAPALERNEIVISDRFLDASVAYQGAGRKLPIEWVYTLNKICLEGKVPDITFILDLSLMESRKRLLGRDLFPDRLERERDPFFEAVRQQYIILANSDKRRFCLVNGNRNLQEISDEIWKRVMEVLSG